MKVPLSVRLFLSFFLTAAVAFVLLLTAEKPLVKKQAETEARARLAEDAAYIADAYSRNEDLNTPLLLDTISRMSGSEVWFMDTSGNVRFSSGKQKTPFSVPDFHVSDGTGGYTMTGTFYDTFGETVLTVYRSLARSGSLRGYVLLHYPMSEVLREADRIQFFAYLAYWIFLVLLTLLYFWILLTTVGPIRKVATASKEYANQNLTYPSRVRRNDEIGEIALSTEELVRRLQSSADDEHRFLQNISHDFRSPLTSIRGYMVAIQDGTIPPELQGKYLDIAISETDRLTNLANGLLDITRLENGVLEITEFDVNGLIREVLPTFEGRVEEKNISFELVFEREEEPVKADPMKIGQVLHNLVDNAIKFSPNDSVIELSTRRAGSKVYVSVKDHGAGIEKENLDKIWTRFYKTDASRGKDKKGSGLGLSIVRDIIQNHKERIDVTSTPGVGTEFVFTLAAVE